MPEVTHITTSQVAQRFGVSTSAVRKWIQQKKLRPAFSTPGGHHRFLIADVEALLSAKTPPEDHAKASA